MYSEKCSYEYFTINLKTKPHREGNASFSNEYLEDKGTHHHNILRKFFSKSFENVDPVALKLK
jgi:hypothetical protein